MRRSAEDIIEIGRDLIEVKAALPHGEFGDWLRAEFAMDERQAQRFITVADRFGKTDRMSDFSPTVLYEFAAPKTPPEAWAEVEKLTCTSMLRAATLPMLRGHMTPWHSATAGELRLSMKLLGQPLPMAGAVSAKKLSRPIRPENHVSIG